MARPLLEVADILDAHGDAFIAAHRGRLSLGQLEVMSAIRACRTAALGGHVARCDDCAHTVIAYNSCRNRHCPKGQGAAARTWLAERQAGLLPVATYHVVFTPPAALGAVAFHNKAVVYDLLFKTAAETLTTIAADPKHLGARIGLTAVLHTWGSALTHHPHVHIIVPGGGLSPDASRWIACKPGFFLPVRVLSRLFRRIFLDKLTTLHEAGRLSFYGDLGTLADRKTFDAYLAPLRRTEWVVYAKRPFAGPEAVLAYLSRYTHRVAISNSRLVALRDNAVSFSWKDYRAKGRGNDDAFVKTMTLQDHDAAGKRVHPPLPSPRPARRVPPHPPLRPVRQRHARRRYRPHQSSHRRSRARRDDGRARAVSRPRRCRSDGGRPGSCQQRRCIASTVSMLRRIHDRHRTLRARPSHGASTTEIDTS